MILGRNNDFAGLGSSAEDNLRLRVIRDDSQDVVDKNMYKDTAKRVVFWNCMDSCGLDNKSIPNFGRNFYYNQNKEQVCLQECYNARMALHFGSLALEE